MSEKPPGVKRAGPVQDEVIAILGAGVAGLSAAYALQGRTDIPFVLYEKEDYIGGISRTMCHGDFRFDLGGHRFYTKNQRIAKLIEDLVGADLLTVNRLSRIYFNKRFVNYPLSALNALRALGVVGATRATCDYVLEKIKRPVAPHGLEPNFERWTVSRFGQYLYRVYFKTYTEKLWGIPCTELSADFAEQRIKGLSFREAVKEALTKKSQSSSLVRNFLYPRWGFGQIPDALAAAIEPPNKILTGHCVQRLRHDGRRITFVVLELADGTRLQQPCADVLTSLPLRELVTKLEPEAPPHVREAAERLSYRDMLILFLAIDREHVSRDNWIYVPSAEIGFARLHEPKNWSECMSPPDRTSLVLEYFCQEGDTRWNQADSDIASEAAAELDQIGLLGPDEVLDHAVVRVRKAYPMYTVGYRENLRVVQSYLARFANLQNIGRSAAFCYTSSDYYIEMGLKAAENLLGASHELHTIGWDREYAEQLER